MKEATGYTLFAGDSKLWSQTDYSSAGSQAIAISEYLTEDMDLLLSGDYRPGY